MIAPDIFEIRADQKVPLVEKVFDSIIEFQVALSCPNARPEPLERSPKLLKELSMRGLLKTFSRLEPAADRGPEVKHWRIWIFKLEQ